MRYLALFYFPAFFVLNNANLCRFALEVFPDVLGLRSFLDQLILATLVTQ